MSHISFDDTSLDIRGLADNIIGMHTCLSAGYP